MTADYLQTYRFCVEGFLTVTFSELKNIIYYMELTQEQSPPLVHTNGKSTY